MDLNAALNNIEPSRKAILLIGAGFSNAAPNLAGMPTPSAKQLSDRILTELNIPGEAPLGLAVDKLREKRPALDAFEFINRQLKVSAITEDQRYVLSLPWLRIYTTNLDNIGTKFTSRDCHDAGAEERPVKTGDIVYLHGCIENCTPANYYARLKLGEQMYLSGRFGYMHLLKQDLYEADSVIVIGYSMADPDLAQAFFGAPDNLNKCFAFSGIVD